MKGYRLFCSFLPGFTFVVLTSQVGWANTAKLARVEPVILPTTELGLLAIRKNGLLNHQFSPQLAIGDNLDDLAGFSFGSENMLGILANPIIIPTGLQSKQLLAPNYSNGFVPKDELKLQLGSRDNLHLFSLESEPPLDLSNRFVAQVESTNKLSINKKLLPASWQNVVDGRKKTNVLNNSLEKQQPHQKVTGLNSNNKCDGLLENQEINLSVSQCRKVSSQKVTGIPSRQLAQANSRKTTPVVKPGEAKPNGNSNQIPNSGISTPVVTPVVPKPGGSSIQIPEYLKPNPNLLRFPTQPSEVQLKAAQPLTLNQALELARRNNRELQVSLLQLESSRSALREQQAALLPGLELNTSIVRQTAGDNTSSVTGINGQAQVNYNLYTSGARQAAIRTAEEQVRSSELTVEQQSETIRLNVTGQYYDLQQADENIRISAKAVENAQASLRDTQALQDAGVGTQFDVLRSQVNLANAQQDLTNAISAQLVAQRQLVVTLNLPQTLTVRASDEVRPAGLWDLTLEESIVLALQNRPELQQTLVTRNQSEQRRRQALAQLGPQVSFIGTYNLADTFDDTLPVNDTYSVRVQARLNLFDGGAARARAAQEKTNIAIAETNFSNQRDQIRFEVERFYSQQQSNLRNIQTATTAVEQAERALELARLRVRAGVGTQTDVINSENDLTRAEGNRVQAILNYNRALASLQRAVTLRGLQRR